MKDTFGADVLTMIGHACREESSEKTWDTWFGSFAECMEQLVRVAHAIAELTGNRLKTPDAIVMRPEGVLDCSWVEGNNIYGMLSFGPKGDLTYSLGEVGQTPWIATACTVEEFVAKVESIHKSLGVLKECLGEKECSIVVGLLTTVGGA